MTRNGATVLQGQLGVWTDAFHSVDLETGALSGPITGTFGTDAFLPAANGGWTCVCMVDRVDTDRMDREVDLVRLAADGLDQQRQKVTTFSGDQGPPEQGGSYGVQTDVAVAPDGRTALVVAGQRDRGGWSFVAISIDLATGKVVGTSALGRKETPKPGPSALPSTASDGTPTQLQTDVYGPLVRRSPDGRHALVWTTLQQYTQDTSLLTDVFGWSVELDADGNVTGSAPSPGVSSLPPYCGGMGFIDDATFAAVCAVNTERFVAPGLGARPARRGRHSCWGRSRCRGPRTGTRSRSSTSRTGSSGCGTRPSLILHRIELDSNRVTTQQYDTLVERADGSARPPDHQPGFARANSSLYQDVSWDMAAAPDGSRLYLVGYDAAKSSERGNQASAGIFVVTRDARPARPLGPGRPVLRGPADRRRVDRRRRRGPGGRRRRQRGAVAGVADIPRRERRPDRPASRTDRRRRLPADPASLTGRGTPRPGGRTGRREMRRAVWRTRPDSNRRSPA